MGRVGSTARSLDRHIPSLCPAVWIVALVGLWLYDHAHKRPVLLQAVSHELFIAFMSATVGASASLLGFVVAALTVLVTLSGRAPHNTLRARQDLSKVLLWLACFLLVDLMTGILSILSNRSVILQLLNISAALASVFGLVLGGIAFTLVIIGQGLRVESSTESLDSQ
jgi:hypothetical protein